MTSTRLTIHPGMFPEHKPAKGQYDDAGSAVGLPARSCLRAVPLWGKILAHSLQAL